MLRSSIAVQGLGLLAPALAFAQAAPAPPVAPAPAAAPAAPASATAPEAPAPPTAPAAVAPVAPPPAAAPPPATPAPPPAAPQPPAAAPPPATPAPPYHFGEPPPPPERSTDLRPVRERRPFSIAGELGWNSLAGLGANFSYHPSPYFAIDTGVGIAISGARIGVRARVNFLKGEWTPFVAAGTTYSDGTGDNVLDYESKDEKTRYRVLPSSYLHFAGGVNYTGDEGFVFTATTGYAALVRSNTRFVDGNFDSYKEIRAVYRGGLILSVAFGYAF